MVMLADKQETSVLGELLLAKRAETSLSLDSLSSSSGLSADRIESVESGRHDLSDEELDRLLKAYRVAPRAGRLSGLVVEVNLDGGWVSMRKVRRLSGGQPAADRNLLTYLNLVYEDRSLPLGSEISVRSIDLSLLRPALAIRRSEVQLQLDRMTAQIPSALRQNRSLLAVAAAAGIAVAAGAVILVPAGGTGGSAQSLPADTSFTQTITSAEDLAPPPVDAAESLIDIGTAVVIERSVPAATAAEDAETQVTPGTIDPRIQIGTALVVERSAEEVVESSSLGSSRTSRGPPSPTASPTNERENS